MGEVKIATLDPAPIQAEYEGIVARAMKLTVANQLEHEDALVYIRNLRAGEKAIEERFEPSRKALDLAKKEVLNLRDGLIAPLAEARRVISKKCDAYELEERRKADEERKRLEEQARKQEEDRRLEEAILAEEAGDKKAAEQILAEPPPPPPIIHVAPRLAEVRGISMQTRWHAEITDPAKFVAWLVQNPQEIEMARRAAEACLPILNERARNQREALVVPGVRPVSETVRATRAV